jgi:hypothetical protein
MRRTCGGSNWYCTAHTRCLLPAHSQINGFLSWAQVDMFHKLMLTSVVAFFPKDVLIPVGIVMAMSYLFVIILLRPYYRKGDDRLHGFAQIELFLLMLRCASPLSTSLLLPLLLCALT